MGLAKEGRLVGADTVDHPGALGAITRVNAPEVGSERVETELPQPPHQPRGEQSLLRRAQRNARLSGDQVSEESELSIGDRTNPEHRGKIDQALTVSDFGSHRFYADSTE